MKKYTLILLLSSTLFANVHIGEQAPDFKLNTLDKNTSIQLSSLRGQIVLVNIWASWCKGCKKEMPEFFKLQHDYAKGFKIVTVSVDDEATKAQFFLQSVEKKVGFKTPFITLHDTNKNVAKAYQCSAIPSSYLIDKKGVIRDIIIDSLDEEDIQALKQKINHLK